MTRVLTSRRWQLAWWGSHAVCCTAFGAVFWAPDSWLMLSLAWTCAYVCGFLAAVLVEIGTQ